MIAMASEARNEKHAALFILSSCEGKDTGTGRCLPW
jgi:hypothetical protein